MSEDFQSQFAALAPSSASAYEGFEATLEHRDHSFDLDTIAIGREVEACLHQPSIVAGSRLVGRSTAFGGDGLRVHSFSPSTQLTSDLSKETETTTTTKKERSLGATLGGALPAPHGAMVAQVSLAINANTSASETVTEKLNRLPPKYAVIVSGTSSDGRGVFFKLKRSSQSSLEGVHELAVVFLAPVEWQRGEVSVVCSARGTRNVLWIKRPTTFSRATGTVQLSVADTTLMPHIVRRLPEIVPARNTW